MSHQFLVQVSIPEQHTLFHCESELLQSHPGKKCEGIFTKFRYMAVKLIVTMQLNKSKKVTFCNNQYCSEEVNGRLGQCYIEMCNWIFV